jgi:hypothetical protein
MNDRVQLDTRGVAAHLGLKPKTITRYNAADFRERYGFPEPDGHLGGRPWWWDTTIDAWERPGRGYRGGAAQGDTPVT